MIDICLAGTGGMVPLHNRFLTSLHFRYQGECFLIDCGEATQITLRKHKCSISSIRAICLTHLHADHTLGLPGLLSTMGNEGRNDPLTIYGPKGTAELVEALCKAIVLVFKVNIVEYDQDEHCFSLGDLDFQAFLLKHRIACYGYKISLKRAPEFLPEKATSLGLPVQFWSLLQKGKTVTHQGKTYVPEDVLGEARKGLSFVYATDTRPTKGLVEKGMGTDLMILEGMYADDSFLPNAIEKWHMLSSEAATIAKEAKTKRLWLTHYSPSFLNKEEALKPLQKIFENTQFCHDGEKTTLYFEEKKDYE